MNFGITHRVVDGLGISIYRLFCIKSSLLVNGKVQERKLFQSINYGGPFISIILTLIFNHGGSNDSVTESLCTGKSVQMGLDFLARHGIEMEEVKAHKTFVAAILVGMTSMELSCYLIFFHHCYKNDNGPIKHLLPKAETKRRNQRNAITFLGQMYGFIIEFSFMLGTLLSTLEPNIAAKEIAGLVAMLGYGIMSAIIVLTSDPIRKHLLGNVNY